MGLGFESQRNHEQNEKAKWGKNKFTCFSPFSAFQWPPAGGRDVARRAKSHLFACVLCLWQMPNVLRTVGVCAMLVNEPPRRERDVDAAGGQILLHVPGLQKQSSPGVLFGILCVLPFQVARKTQTWHNSSPDLAQTPPPPGTNRPEKLPEGPLVGP